MRYTPTDDLWTSLEPLIQQAKWFKGGQPPKLSDRNIFEALLCLARTGIPWRDLPAECGRWDAVYNRFRRWVRSGGLRRMFEAVTAEPEFEGIRRILIDSTIIRAHQHAAGARRKVKRSGRSGRPRLRPSAAVVAD